MKASDATHPSHDELLAYLAGKLNAVDSESIETHLNQCESCCEALSAVPSEDTIDSMLRQKEADTSVSPETPSAQHEPREDGIAPTIVPESDEETRAPRGEATAIPGLDADGLKLPPELRDHPRYKIVELLGHGGMGDVYHAEHKVMNRQVALKVIKPQLVQSDAAVKRFQREVQAAARLEHPNIVTAFDAEQAGDLHYLVMSFVDGVDLDEVIRERGPLPVEEACDYIRQAAEGLQHAHDLGMVHRDIKPHNLMVCRSRLPSGTSGANDSVEAEADPARQAGPTVKILDFGLANFANEVAEEELTHPELGDETGVQSVESTVPGASILHQLTQMGTMMGTPDYIAPEQAEDAHSADIRADIYSLGCTFYTLLTGQAPFVEGSVIDKVRAHTEQNAPPLADTRDDVPPEVEAVLKKMMAKDPAERYQTPAEVAAALSSVAASCQLADSDLQPRQAGSSSPRKRRPLVLTAVALLFLGLIAAVATIFYIQTDNGVVRVEVTDPTLKVTIAGQTITTDDNGKPLTIRAGEQKLIVRQKDSDFELVTDSFQLRRGDEIVLKVDRLPGEVVVSKDGERFGAKTLPTPPNELQDRLKTLVAEVNDGFGIQDAVRWIKSDSRPQAADRPQQSKFALEWLGGLSAADRERLFRDGYLQWSPQQLDPAHKKLLELMILDEITGPIATNHMLATMTRAAAGIMEKIDVGFLVVEIPNSNDAFISWYRLPHEDASPAISLPLIGWTPEVRARHGDSLNDLLSERLQAVRRQRESKNANRVVVEYIVPENQDPPYFKLDGETLQNPPALFSKLRPLVAKDPQLVVQLRGDLNPNNPDYWQLNTLITSAGVTKIELPPGLREEATRIMELNLIERLAQRKQALRKIGAALNKGAWTHFPPNPNLKPEVLAGLSWRVHLLPLLGHGELYLKFKHFEPWDSEHNKALLAQMPDVYKTTEDATKTTFLMVVGEGTGYEGGAGIAKDEFSDGLSNTALVVDAGRERAVPWTKPEDLPFDSEDPIRAFGTSDFGDEFLALMADASVRSIPYDTAPESLRALFTRAAGDKFNRTAKRTTPRTSSKNEFRVVFYERNGGDFIEISGPGIEKTVDHPEALIEELLPIIRQRPSGVTVLLDAGEAGRQPTRDEVVGLQSIQSVLITAGAAVKLDPQLSQLLMDSRQRSANRAKLHMERSNNLKEVGQALLNYQTVHNVLPPAKPRPALFNEKGRPHLSWRVHILPHLEQKELYDKFHLDEPWDSEHNKPLLAEMPDVFKTTDDPTKTTLLMVVGEGTAYEGKEGLNLNRDFFLDGTSNTALVVDAGRERAVPWTQPRDQVLNSEDPIRAFGTSDFGEEFLALMADGSTQAVAYDTAPEQLRSLFLRADGNPLDLTQKRTTPVPRWADRLRAAERRRQLGDLSVAISLHEKTYGRFPIDPESGTGTPFDENGRARLSWRVHLLPFMGQNRLFHRFAHDEPWDSPHNKALLAEMPDVYKTTDDPTKTTFLAVVGKGTGYEGAAGLKHEDFKDGIWETALVVDAGRERAVPWTKPEDLPLDAEDPIRSFGTPEFDNRFLYMQADSGVTWAAYDTAPESLRALFTRAAGDKFDPTAKRTTPLPHVWRGKQLAEVMSFKGHTGPITGVEFSPDGKLAASFSGGEASDGTVLIWNVADGKVVRKVEYGDEPPTAIAFSPDSKRIAIGGADFKAYVYDVHGYDLATKKYAIALTIQPGAVNDLAFTPDGEKLLIWSERQGTFWSMADPKAKEQKELFRGKANAGRLAISPDGLLVALGNINVGVIHLKQQRTISHTADIPPVTDIAFLPDSKRFVVTHADANNSASLYDTATSPATKIRGFDVGAAARGLAVTPDGRHVVIADDTSRLTIWSVETGEKVDEFATPEIVTGLDISPDGKTLLTGGGYRKDVDRLVPATDFDVHLWQLPESVRPEVKGDAALRRSLSALVELKADGLIPHEAEQWMEREAPSLNLDSPLTHKALQLLAELPAASHERLLADGYLRWRPDQFDPRRRAQHSEIVQWYVGWAFRVVLPAGGPKGRREELTARLLENADVGFAVVDLPQPDGAMICWCLIASEELPFPGSFPLIGMPSEVEKAHGEQVRVAQADRLRELRDLPVSPVPEGGWPAAETPTYEALRKQAVVLYTFEKDTFQKGRVLDKSGNGNDALIEGDEVAYTPDGKVGGGLLCGDAGSGEAALAKLRLPQAFCSGKKEYTLAMWVKATAKNETSGVLYREGIHEKDKVAWPLQVQLNKGRLEATCRGNYVEASPSASEAATPAGSIPSDRWCFLALALTPTPSGRMLHITIDDKTWEDDFTRFGNLKGGFGLLGGIDGMIDEVAFFGRALTEQEVESLRKRELPESARPETGPPKMQEEEPNAADEPQTVDKHTELKLPERATERSAPLVVVTDTKDSSNPLVVVKPPGVATLVLTSKDDGTLGSAVYTAPGAKSTINEVDEIRAALERLQLATSKSTMVVRIDDRLRYGALKPFLAACAFRDTIDPQQVRPQWPSLRFETGTDKFELPIPRPPRNVKDRPPLLVSITGAEPTIAIGGRSPVALGKGRDAIKRLQTEIRRRLAAQRQPRLEVRIHTKEDIPAIVLLAVAHACNRYANSRGSENSLPTDVLVEGLVEPVTPGTELKAKE